MGPGRLAVIIALGVCFAPPAGAQGRAEGGTRLSYVRAANAAGCISAPALEGEVVRRMGRDPFVGPPHQWIEAFVELDESGYYTVELFERDERGKTLGRRNLRERAGDCSQLTDALVLAVALIIDPAAELGPIAPGRDSEPGSASRLEPAPVPAPLIAPPLALPCTPMTPPRPAVPEREQNAAVRSVTATVALAGVAVGGVLPGFAPGVELKSTLPVVASGSYALQFSALYLPESRSDDALGEVGYGLTSLEAGACRVETGAQFGWFGCAALGFGAVHSVVHQPLPFHPGDRFWAAFRLAAGLKAHLAGPFWAEAALFDLIAPVRWEFRVKNEQGSRTAFQQSWLMPGASLGVGLHL